jgi:arylformamidase
LNLEAQYNNRALVPDHPAVMQRWRETAEAARAAHPPLEIAYGPGAREVMDLFEAAPGAPVAVFLHGGYWQALDKSWFSGLAPALLAHGVSLAIPSYDLCPAVRLAVRRAVVLVICVPSRAVSPVARIRSVIASSTTCSAAAVGTTTTPSASATM